MGLLSGGQILSKKRKIGNKFKGQFSGQRDGDDDDVEPGSHVTSFPNKSILELKNNLRSTIDEFSQNFDEQLREELIEESKKVFENNNLIINSVAGVGAQLRKNLRNFLGCLLLFLLSLYLFVKMWRV